MATVGLRVQGSGLDGSFSLADTLAKAAFGDPEGIMKARLMASQVGAHDAYAANLAEKTREDAIAQRNRDAAGPAMGDAAAAAVPAPVVVTEQDALRRIVPPDTSYGPQFPHADPIEVARVDKLRTAERAMGPLFANGTPEQVAKGFNTNYGGAILAGAAGNPAIVNPDSLRIASTLYTGSAPTTSTVMTSGDFAGVDAKAREDLAVKAGEAALPEKPHDVTYRGQPGQTYRDPITGKLTYTGAAGTEQTPEKADIVDLPGGGKGTLLRDAAGNIIGVTPIPGAESRPEKPNIIDLPGGGKGTVITDSNGNVVGVQPLVQGRPEKPVIVDLPSGGKGEVGTDGQGRTALLPVQGGEAPPPELGTEKGRASIISQIMELVSQPVDPLRPDVNRPSPTQARNYDQAYTTNYGAKTQFQNVNGVPTPIRVWPSRPGFYSPKDIYKLAGIDPPAPLAGSPEGGSAGDGGQPVQTGGAGRDGRAMPTPVTTGGGDFGIDVGQGLGDPKPPVVTAEQTKARLFLPTLQKTTAILDGYTKKNVPSTFELGYTAPSEELGTFDRYVEGSPLISDNARRYGQAANAWTSTQLYDLSGAAIGKGEFDRAVRGFLPRPNDPDDVIQTKKELRHSFVETLSDGAYPNDKAAHAKILDLLAKGDALARTNSPRPKTKEKPSGEPPKKRVYDENGNLK